MSSLNPILGVASSSKKKATIRKRPNHVSFRPGVKKGVGIIPQRTPIRKPNSTNNSKVAVPSSSSSTTEKNASSEQENKNENVRPPPKVAGTTVGKRPPVRPLGRPRPILRPAKRSDNQRGSVSVTPSIHSQTVVNDTEANDSNNNNNNDDTNNDTTAVVKKVPETNNQSALDVISTTISSSVPRGSDKFDKEKEMSMIPYQFLGKLDPSWNIPAPKQGEKTMKDFCTKFPIPRAKTTRRGRGKRGTANNINDPEDVTSVITSSSSVKVERPPSIHQSSSQLSSSSQSPNNNNSIENKGPAVEIINGEIVIQQSSITISNRKTMKEIDDEYLQEEGDLVVEDTSNGVINATYRSFLKETPKTQHWSPAETHQFYTVLRQCGTDFSMMTSFFPDRTRKQLKKKYLQESRKNPKLIDLAMNPHTHLPVDTTVFGTLDMTNVTDVKALAEHQVNLTAEKEPPKVVSPSPDGETDEAKEMENGMEVVVEEADNDFSNEKQKDELAISETSKKDEQLQQDEGETAADANVTLGLFGGNSKKKTNKARPKFKVVKKRPNKPMKPKIPKN